MSRLAFLSPHECQPQVRLVSPLRRVRSDVFTDVSSLGKLEVRGEELPDGALPLGPGRGLLVVDGDVRETRDRLVLQGYRVYDQTGALAALEVARDVMRRLTELDLSQLPAIGAIARGTPALIEQREGDRYRLFVPQELAHYVAEVADDMAQGLDS